MEEDDRIFLHNEIIERVEEIEEVLFGETHHLPHQAVIRSDAFY